MDMNGVINVYKEAGFTSHDVVAKLRGILHQKKIGHTGTLDPQAVGVLPVCLGKATKLCDVLADHDKVYETVLRLGITTDTQDMSGSILAEKEVRVSEEEVRECIASFQGEQQQIPPMYSALKVNGKKLYELAREGIEVERKARTVHFYELEIQEIQLPLVMIRVHCSKGTYIRTLCHDIGEKLGCGGCMERLVRTRVERFCLEDAMTLSQIEKEVAENRFFESVIPIDQMFSEQSSLCMSQRGDLAVHNGNSFLPELVDQWPQDEISEGARVRIYDSTGQFIGIYRKKEERFIPEKMFFVKQEIDRIKQ